MTTSPKIPERYCFYDADCGICSAFVRLGARLDRRGHIAFVPNHETGQWPAGVTQELVQETIVVVERGRSGYLVRGAAVASLVRALPLGGLLGWWMGLPGVRQLVDRAYRWVARHRLEISSALGLGVCGVQGRNGPGGPGGPGPRQATRPAEGQEH